MKKSYIKEVFENYEKLKDNVKIAGVYIDNKLEAYNREKDLMKI